MTKVATGSEMTPIWLLTSGADSLVGNAYVIEPVEFNSSNDEGEGFDVFCLSPAPANDVDGNKSALLSDAERSSQLTHQLLYYDKVVDRASIDGSYRFPGTNKQGVNKIRGHSVQLAFALAAVVGMAKYFNKDLQDKRVSPGIAATGRLNDNCEVLEVHDVPQKLRAILKEQEQLKQFPLERNQTVFFFYPLANQGDIDLDLRLQAQAENIELKPVRHLIEAMGALGIDIKQGYLKEPYRGLDSFEYRHHSIYCGRKADINQLRDKLLKQEHDQKPGILILGASGSGKSSLVQAGLLPALIEPCLILGETALENKRTEWCLWRPRDIITLPKNIVEPKDVGAVEGCRSVQDSWAQRLPELSALGEHTTFDALADAWQATWPKGKRFVWVVDQLEELFTLGFPELFVTDFCHFLGAMQKRSAWVVATLRNDFYHHYQQHDALLTVFPDNEFYQLKKLGSAALRQVIETPALKAKLEWDADVNGVSLAARLLDDMQRSLQKDSKTDALPLLEFALNELFSKRDGSKLTFDAYEKMGGLQGAIGEKAEKTFKNFCEKYSQEVAEAALARVILALTIYQDEVGAARPEHLDAFPDGSAARDLINKLIGARLLAFEDRIQINTPITIRVAHEALLTHWGKAQDIIEQSKKDLILRDRLEQEAARWSSAESCHQPDLLLPSGRKLNEANEWLEQLGEEEKKLSNAAIISYINASDKAEENRLKDKQEADRRKLKVTQRWTIALSLLAMAAIIGGYKAYQQKNILGNTLAKTDFSKGAKLALESKPREALAYLAQAIRINGDKNSATLAASLLAYEIQTPYWVNLQHQGAVQSAVFSPDGRWVVTASDDNTARVWDAATGEPVSAPMVHNNRVESVVFSPDGRRVVTQTWGMTSSHIWDVATGQQIPIPWLGQISSFVSPDGRQIVTVENNTASILDAATGLEISAIMQEGDVLSDVVFSPNGKRILTISENYISVWDSATGQLVGTPIPLTIRNFSSAAFSSDGHWVVTVSDDHTARVWDATTGQPVGAPMANESEVVASVMFSPNGKQIVTILGDNVIVRDATTGQPVGAPIKAERLKSAAFSPNGQQIITISYHHAVCVWDIATGELVSIPMMHKEDVESAVFSPDGRRIVTASGNNAIIWDSTTGRPIPVPKQHQRSAGSAVFSPGGRRVTTVSENIAHIWNALPVSTLIGEKVNKAMFSPDGHWIVTASDDHTARVWDAATGEPVSIPMVHKEKINFVEFSPDGRWVVTASDDNTARVWDAATGEPVSAPMVHNNRVESVVFSPDGRRIVTASGFYASVWDVTTNQLVFVPVASENELKSATFSSDGEHILTVSWGYNGRTPFVHALVLDATTGKPLSLPIKIESSHSAVFSPDGRWVVTVSDDNNSARTWHTSFGQPVSIPMVHKGKINFVEFSPDGHWVVTASDDHTARVWDAATGEPVSIPMVHEKINSVREGYVISAAFSPDGQRVITTSDNYTARVWDAATGQPLSAPMVHKGKVESAVFSSNGRWVVTISRDYNARRAARVWDLMPMEPASNDFAIVLEQISGCRLLTINSLDCKPPISLFQLRTFVNRLTDLNTEEDRFLNWLLEDPYERTLSPNHTNSVHSLVERLIADGSANSLNKASQIGSINLVELDIGVPSELLAKVSLKFAPNNLVARASAGFVLSRQARFGKLTLPMSELQFREDDHAVFTEKYVGTPKAFDPPGLSDTLRSGLALLRGDGVKQDFKQGVALLQKAAAAGETYAEYQLARAQSSGVGMQKNETEACHRFTQLAEKGLPQAQNSLGWCYENGIISIFTITDYRDYEQARTWYEKAAAQNYSPAIFNLGNMALKGEGVEESPRQAADYFGRAAELGYANAALNLAELYEQGSVSLSSEDALTWYRKAAELGNSDALLRLASFYEAGIILPKSLEQAIALYRQAALAGHPVAQFKLGTLIRDGKTTDSHDAMYWFTKAAQQGSPAGQFAVGLLYELGEGVKKNLTEARRWYQRVLDAKLPEDDMLRQEAERRNRQKDS